MSTERILVAVDFSDCSRAALRTAFELSHAFAAPVRVLYVTPEIFRHLRTSRFVLPVSPDAPRVERELTDLILAEYKGSADEFPRIDKHIREGIEGREILAEVEEWRPTVLVLGTHGRSAASRMFLGSVSDRVLRSAGKGVSVLTVPEQAATAPRRILAAIDGDPLAPAVLRTASRWKQALGAELDVLHVTAELSEPMLLRIYSQSDLQAPFRALQDEVRTRVEAAVRSVLGEAGDLRIQTRSGRHAWSEICAAAEHGRHDLVVLGAHADPTANDLGPTTARVAHSCTTPVLVVRT